MFRIDTGELRGTITVPLHAENCHVDPSGLYVFIVVPPFSHQTTLNQQKMDLDFASLSSSEKDLHHNTILAFEIGTGLAAAEIQSVFDITKLSFSGDGRYLALASSSGSLSIWATGDQLFNNMTRVMEAIKACSTFWHNFPIYLTNYK